MKTIDEIKKWLKENLDEERFSHSLGVAKCAKELAEKYKLDAEKAYLAGLVHDCAKCFEDEFLLDILENEMNCDMEELLNPKTYHSPAGAFFARETFGIEDEEILEAIAHLDLTDDDTDSLITYFDNDAILSLLIGFLLYAIADEPICFDSKGSSISFIFCKMRISFENLYALCAI